MAIGVTPKQSQLFEFVAGFIDRHGYPPTLKDIRAHTGARSPTGSLDMLNALAKKGLLRRQKHIARGLTITDEGRAFLADIEARRQRG